MSRHKSFLEKPAAVSGELRRSTGSGIGTRLLQLAPESGTGVAKSRPTLQVRSSELRTNLRPEAAVAVIVSRGSPIEQGELELVGPGANINAPVGSRVAGLIHADGTAVQFHDRQGGVFLSVAVAKREFGAFVVSARHLLKSQLPTVGPTILRRADSTGSVTPTASVEAALKTSVSQPLPPRSQAALESTYGTSLSDVRVHTDSHADHAAKSLQAKAFATGQDIYFRSGHYQPGVSSGDHLLAHEVAHTVQQGSNPSGVSRSPNGANWQISQPNDAHELDADQAADAAVQRLPAEIHRISGSQAASPLARRMAGPQSIDNDRDSSSPLPQSAEAKAASQTSQPIATVVSAEGGGSELPLKSAQTDSVAPFAAELTPPSPALRSPISDLAPPSAAAAVVPEVASTSSKESGGTPGSVADGAGLAAVTAEVSAAGQSQRAHQSEADATAETARSTDVTPDEAKGKAQGDQVERMAAQKQGQFNRIGFKNALKKKIESLQAEDAKGIKEGDQAQNINDAVKSEVTSEKQAAAGPINQVSQQAPPAGEPKSGEKLRESVPAPLSQVDGSRAVPNPVPEHQRSMTAESHVVDQQLTSAQVTSEQLQRANEPEFQGAATAHATARTEADALPERANSAEAAVLQNSQAQATQSTQSGLAEMQGRSAEKLGASRIQQTEGKAKYEATRKRISDQLGAVYQETKLAVDIRLATLNQEVNSKFDSGASFAKTKFYAFIGAKLLIYYAGGGWLVDAFTGDNTKEEIFREGQDQYLADMDAVIDQVADVVETGLNDVVSLIEAGRVRLEAELKQFETSDAKIAQEVAGGLREQFAALEKTVEEQQTAIIDSLAEKYVAAQKDVQSTIDTLRDPVGALIDIAVDAVAGVIETIFKMKDLLTSALSKAGEAIDLILADPIGFLGHLVAGVKQGVMGFLSNIGAYLQKGLLDWLFGAVAQAGIQMPDTFDLSGLMSIVLQVLGLTWTNIRQRAVAIVGEPVVQALETGSEIIKTLISKGAAGLWDYIKEQASALMETVKEGVKSFIMESVIVAGVKWLIGLLNPASAFVKACMAIYDIVTFIINKGQQILEFVNAVLDSVLAIAQGNVAPAAKAVESALARSIPVAIGFLASLLGVGDLGEKITKVIDKIQAPVNKVIDWLIQKAVALVKAIGKMFGGKEKGQDDDRSPMEREKDRDLALESGEKLFSENALDIDTVKSRLIDIKTVHRVARLELVVEGKEGGNSKVHIVAENSPKKNGVTHVLTGIEVPTDPKEFDVWFMNAADELLNAVWNDKKSLAKVKSLLRGPRGQHEFLMVGMARHWRKWGVPPSEARELFSVSISWLNRELARDWKHTQGSSGLTASKSGTAHDELSELIRSSKSLPDFQRRFDDYAARWLNEGAGRPPGTILN